MGFDDIVIKDAHGSGRNIIPDQLPEYTRLIRGWSGHPYTMMQGLNSSFDAAFCIGYHSAGGSSKNPLAHTISLNVNSIKINGVKASEFLINSYISALENVPIVFISRDHNICNEALKINRNIITLAVLEGEGSSVASLSPQKTISELNKSIMQIPINKLNDFKIELPEVFNVEINFSNPYSAQKASFYPGVSKSKGLNINYETNSYMEVLTLFKYVL